MPFADPERRRAYHRERQRRRRAAGLCAQCNQSVVEGQTRCVEHRGQADVGSKIRSVTKTIRRIRANLERA